MEDVKKYSLKADGNKKLGKSFLVSGFACKDKSDSILISGKLVAVLQKIRDHFGKVVTITSGYRTAAYNKKIDGAAKSFHVEGMAADITVAGVALAEVAKYAESIGVKGIGLYSTWVHVDVRTSKYFWKNYGTEIQVNSFGAAAGGKPALIHPLKINMTGGQVKTLQTLLIKNGYQITADGNFGAGTQAAVKGFQKKNKLAADGVVGKETWSKL